MVGSRWWRRAGASWKCLHSPRVFTEGSLKVHEQSLKEGTGFYFGIMQSGCNPFKMKAQLGVGIFSILKIIFLCDI